MPIQAGPAAGLWFSLFSGMRYLRGTYDQRSVTLFLELLKPGAVVYDLGAHAGYYSLIAARAVAPEGKVYAFEPLLHNLTLLRGHVSSNRLHSITVMPLAVSASVGQATLDLGKGTGRAHLSRAGNPAGSGGGARGIDIQVTTLDAQVASGTIAPPDVIKMDVEGAEAEVLTGAAATLSQYRPSLLISVHSPELSARCAGILQSHGYQVETTHKSGQILGRPSADHGLPRAG